MSNLCNRLFRPRNKRWFVKKIRGRITADCQLWKQNQIGGALGRLTREIENLLYVSGEIADSGIDLSERNLHSFSVAILLRDFFPCQLHCHDTISRRNRWRAQDQPIA